MEKTYTTKGIVLLKKDWRENDILFTIYTSDFGKLKLHGIGMKKIKSKLAGQLATPGIIDLMLAKSKTQDKIASAFLAEKFDLDLNIDFPYLCFLYEVFDKAVGEGQADVRLWNLLVKSIKWLYLAPNEEQKKIVLVFFVFRLFKILGYQPKLENCVICQKKIISGNFYFLSNGMICNGCLNLKIPMNQLKSVSKDLYVFLIKIYKMTETENLVIKKTVLAEAWNFIQKWTSYLLEKNINSLTLIK